MLVLMDVTSVCMSVSFCDETLKHVLEDSPSVELLKASEQAEDDRNENDSADGGGIETIVFFFEGVRLEMIKAGGVVLRVLESSILSSLSPSLQLVLMLPLTQLLFGESTSVVLSTPS
jgi:hypothetical protein